METREKAAGSTRMPAPRLEQTIGPLVRGAGWGTVVGAVLGLLTAVMMIIPWSGFDPGTAGGIGEVTGGAVIVAFAGFIGLCFGGVTGFIAGFGAVLVPQQELQRRLAVSGLALAVVGTTAAVLDVAWGPAAYVWEFAWWLLAPVAVASWLLAPRLGGPRRR